MTLSTEDGYDAVHDRYDAAIRELLVGVCRETCLAGRTAGQSTTPRRKWWKPSKKERSLRSKESAGSLPSDAGGLQLQDQP